MWVNLAAISEFRINPLLEGAVGKWHCLGWRCCHTEPVGIHKRGRAVSLWEDHHCMAMKWLSNVANRQQSLWPPWCQQPVWSGRYINVFSQIGWVWTQMWAYKCLWTQHLCIIFKDDLGRPNGDPYLFNGCLHEEQAYGTASNCVQWQAVASLLAGAIGAVSNEGHDNLCSLGS